MKSQGEGESVELRSTEPKHLSSFRTWDNSLTGTAHICHFGKSGKTPGGAVGNVLFTIQSAEKMQWENCQSDDRWMTWY